MRIYISGISGTGMGPLALMAKAAGFDVVGSDLSEGPVTKELKKAKIDFKIGPQDGQFLKIEHARAPIDWFVYTSALPKDHPELKIAEKDFKIKTSKRDELISFLIKKLHLKLVAVAGTHGKTTTTAEIIWACKQLRLPVSYIVGTTLSFGPAGAYDPKSKYFVYEADEYDRNFLAFHPWLSVITTIDYDHPDIYKTKKDYDAAFDQFKSQSRKVIYGNEIDADLELSGEMRRFDATLAMDAVTEMSRKREESALSDPVKKINDTILHAKLVKAMNSFPGAKRRFEKLADGIYTDYAHHPEEIAATLELAAEEAERQEKQGIVVVYQPHQNTRQHAIREGYLHAFDRADKIYWLPTYLTRENPRLRVLNQDELIMDLYSQSIAKVADLDELLLDNLRYDYEDNYLIVLLSAGPADTWLRDHLDEITRPE